MAIERQEPEEPRVPLTQAQSYNAAVQLHNQEFRTLGERNNAFLIGQSILVVALVTLLTHQGLFPWALPIIMWGISIIGILFCFLHHLAGRAGSQAAFMWRRYMSRIETVQTDAPLKGFYEYCEEDHLKHSKPPRERKVCANLRNLWARLQCGRCLLARLPLPSIWIVTPAIFALIWGFFSSYITTRLFLTEDPIVKAIDSGAWMCAARAVSIIVTIFIFGVLCYIICRGRRWWCNPPPESE